MKVIYVVGPYRDCRGTHYIHQNIEQARSVAAELWGMGYAVICPHLNTAHMDGLVSDDQFIDGLLAILERTDMLVAMPGYDRSAGSQIEIARAIEKGIPVIYWPDCRCQL